jgi:GntR family transcriptional regulator/MocR family aminotransferase
MRAAHAAMATHSDSFGWLPLRRAIAAHVHQWRNIRCDPSCVIVTAGSADAFDLIGRALLPHGATVVVENPGYPIARDRLTEAGLLVVPTQVDERGLNPETLSRNHRARAVLTTPSRQFPLGAVMPLERRLALLEWAGRTGGLVIEDDFDSEYRYRGSPHPALASLLYAGNVVYLGSFSKVLSAASRLGFLIVPESKLESVRERLGRRGILASLVPQLALADFISSGDLSSHIRKTRREYASRQAALVAAERHFDGHLTLLPTDGGLHLVGRLSNRLAKRYPDDKFVEVARTGGITVRMLSSYTIGNPPFRGVILGFASFSPEAIDAAARKLARIIIS